MTREEQRAVRELKQTVEKALRPICKAWGYKIAAGWAYRVVNDYIYILSVSAPPIGRGKQIAAKLYMKPTVIDTVFWDVYAMADEVRDKPFSFHLTAAHAPYPALAEAFDAPVASLDDVPSALDGIFQKADVLIAQSSGRFSSLSVFKAEMCHGDDPISRLNAALCDLAEGRYQDALALAREELAKDKLGPFAKLGEGGLCGIYSYIERYCREKAK